MMKWEHILLDRADKVATITLNRPEKSNSFTGRMREDLLEAVLEAAGDPEVRAVVITGAGKAFCTGGDVDEFLSGTTRALSRSGPADRYTMHKIVAAIHHTEKPFIAAVNGVAAGGGCNLALACDIRILSDKARFVQVFSRRGAFPDWGGIYFLPRLVGYAKAAELLFTGDSVDAGEALRIGLANRVVGEEELMDAASRLAGRIAGNAPVPISLIKRGLLNSDQISLGQALDFESYALEICRGTEDFKEGFLSFIEKREAVFRGR